MEQITEMEINLFAENLPSMDEIKTLTESVHCGEADLLKFGEQVEANMGNNGQKARLATGIGLYILGRYSEAIEKLQKAQDCMEKLPNPVISVKIGAARAMETSRIWRWFILLMKMWAGRSVKN